MFNQQHNRVHDSKSTDPTESGRRSGMSSSILNELQNIEYEIQKSTTGNITSRTTPPRRPAPTSSDRGNSRTRNATDKNDPPLTAEKYTEYYRQRWEEEGAVNANQKTPLVRFSDQLEVYTKQSSQRGYQTPTIPILRTRINGSGSVVKSPGMTSSTYSSGGSRDPTPRSAPADKQHQCREPAGTTAHLSAFVSDPPIDQSCKLMFSPAAASRPLEKGTFSLQESRPVEKGSFSLQGTNIRNGSRSRETRIRDQPQRQHDVELNPRRLSADFISTHQAYRNDSTPTPTNRINSNARKRQELAPTPTNVNQTTNQEDDWATTPPGKRIPIPSPTDWNVARLFDPSTTSSGNRKTHSTSSSRSLPSTLPLPPSQQKSEMDESRNDREVESVTTSCSHEWTSAGGEDSPSEVSTESASAYLIDNCTKGKLAAKRLRTRHFAETHPQSSETSSGVDDSAPSTPRVSSNSRSRIPASDSRVHVTSKTGGLGNFKLDKRKKLSYLQLEEDGSQPAINDEEQESVFPNLPKQIEIQVGDEYSLDSTEEEALQIQNKPSTTDRVGNILKRLPRPRSPKVPFQSLCSGGFSYEESFSNSQRDNLVKQSTSDTSDDTHSENFRPVKASKWDVFDKDSASEFAGSNAPLTARRYRRWGSSRTWMIWTLVCTVVICLAAGLPTYFAMTTKGEEAESSFVPQDLKLLQECLSFDDGRDGSFSERYATIREYLRVLSVGTASAIDKPGSPQRQALCWISEFDEYGIDTSSGNHEAIVQRYTLAVLYYSWLGERTAGESGLGNTDFLSSTHECEWDIIMCTHPGSTVTAILLSDKDLQGSLPAEIGKLGHLGKFVDPITRVGCFRAAA
jgi:hypothetical protein